MLVVLTDKNFDREVRASSGSVLVAFTTGWSGTCHILAPMLKSIAAEFSGEVKVGKLDVEAYQEIAAIYNVHDIPSLLFFRGGGVVDHIAGLASRGAITTRLHELANPPMD